MFDYWVLEFIWCLEFGLGYLLFLVIIFLTSWLKALFIPMAA